MIPVAAFAVTATGVSAFSSDILDELDVDLSSEQIAALEEVHELRQGGADREAIKEALEEAGIDQETMAEIKTAVHEYKSEAREAVKAAIEAGDYDAYLDAVSDTPAADKIDSEADFLLLVEAHELRADGDHEGAQAILSGLGFERPEGGHKGGFRGGKKVDG